MEKLIDRFALYLKNKGIALSKADVALGVGNGYIGKQLKSGGSVNSDIIEKILNIYSDINPLWLVTGIGDMMDDMNKNFYLQSELDKYKQLYDNCCKMIELQKDHILILKDQLSEQKKIKARHSESTS